MTGHRCATHDGPHARRTVPTTLGPFVVYDWRSYQGTAGYCPGDDRVSETIEMTGGWEPHGTAIMAAVLDGRPPGFVWDVGCHVGWYSAAAGAVGYPAIGVDGDAENLELAVLNAPTASFRHAWVDETLTVERGPVAFAKIDVEGNDRFAVAALDEALDDHEVAALMVEVSPVFNDTYPAMVAAIVGHGYDAFVVPHHGHPDQSAFFADPLGYMRARTAIAPGELDGAVAAAPQSDFLFLPREGPR